MFCPNCGNQINDGVDNCPNCNWSKNTKKHNKNKNFKIITIQVLVIIVLIVSFMFIKKTLIGLNNNESFSSIDKNATIENQIKKVKLFTDYDSNTSIYDIETVTFGSYPQSDKNGFLKEPIEWVVLEKRDNKALLMSKYILDCEIFNETSGWNGQGTTSWVHSRLRGFLNTKFINDAFNDSEQLKIRKTSVSNRSGRIKEKNTKDKIFCLSSKEARKYLGSGTKGNFLGEKSKTKATEFAVGQERERTYLFKKRKISIYVDDNGYSSFWLRSNADSKSMTRDKKYGYEYFVEKIDYDGYIYWTDDESINGVRPVLWIDLSQ